MQLAKQYPANFEVQFLAYQGIGFFHFFFSHHKQSLRAAYEAHKNLLAIPKQNSFPFFQILCLDLEGHNLIHRYKIHQGLKTLEQAKKIADSNNILAMSQSLQFFILCYRSRYIDKPSVALKKLFSAYNKLGGSEKNSRIDLIFEITNLLVLSGEQQKAQNFLNESYSIVYETENKRQMGKLNFRMTYNMFRSGSMEQALYLAKTARSNLNKVIDRGLVAQIIGLEIKILTAMGASAKKSREDLNLIDQQIDSLLLKRANARALKQDIVINKGEDKVGDLVDRLSRQKSSALYDDIVGGEVYGLLPDYFEIPPGKQCIILHAPKGHTVICNKEKVNLIKKPLGHMLNKLVLALSTGEKSKEQLIQQVWEYQEYSPLRHDQLIYSSITRIRNLLCLSEEQLIFDGHCYKLNIEVINSHNKVQMKNTAEPEKRTTQPPLRKNDFLVDLNEELNYRQTEIIGNGQFQPISVKNYADQFAITTMTALRDMKKMCELGYLKKTGRGRATRYLKTFTQ